MIRLKTTSRWFAAFLGALFVCAGSAHARDIGGTISTTLMITEDSQLVDDVTCTVTGLPCIAIGAPHVTLELNGFTITGQGDAQTACNGGPATFVTTALEDGIDLNAQTDVAIHGPGLIQQFRGPGIFLNKSSGVRVTGVTVSTNCLSGILVGGGSDNDLRGNIAVRNGNGTFPCGGI
jgi:parallel beta-helix repeat protein